MLNHHRIPLALCCAALLAFVACEQDPDDLPEESLQTGELAMALAEQWRDERSAEDEYWDWMNAVFMLGFVRTHELSGDGSYLDYTTDWIDHHYPDIEAGEIFPDASDRVAPNIVAVENMRLSGEDRYPAATAAVDEYLATVPRSDDGAILHWGTHFPDKREVLIDSLFMIGGYLVAMYDVTGDQAYLDQFTEQLAIFADLCKDDGEGLFLHAWEDDDKVNIPAEPIFWARGNSWIVAVSAWYLAVAPDDHAGRSLAESIYRDEVDAFIRYQDDSGLFYTILNRPGEGDNYLETSSTALFAYGVAVGMRAGVLDDDTYRPALAAAVEGLQSQIREEDDGHLTVTGTSYGTVPTTFEIYCGIPVVDDLNLGIGAMLMALSTVDGL